MQPDLAPAARGGARNGLLSESDGRAALDMIDDHDPTSHTYYESLAAAIHDRLAHATLALAAPAGT